METNLSRLECKLKEIILDSREGHSTNYSKSVREDHLHGCAYGKNAFTLDDPATGTTIFMPWKLHRPLELLFFKYSNNSTMPHASFKSFVDEFELFPKFQNTRKKEDILDYILLKCNKNNDFLRRFTNLDIYLLEFEEFLLALFLLAKYRASVLHTNEQFSFNDLLNSLLSSNLDLNLDVLKQDVGNQTDDVVNRQDAGVNATRSVSQNLDGVIYHENGLIVDTNIGKVFESPRKLETKEFTDTVKELNNSKNDVDEPRSRVNHSGTVDTDLVRRLLEVLRDQNLLHDSRNMQERLEREIKLRDDLESRYIDRLNKVESEKDELSKEYVSYKINFSKLRVDFDNLEREYGQYRTEKESDLSKLNSLNRQLTSDLAEANKILERQKQLRDRSQKTQKLLMLETEFEVKLFSIFCVYKEEFPVDGEFVLSEEQLVCFCLDFGLGETSPPANPDDLPKAKQAYNQVLEFCHDGKLTYNLFKEFLMCFGQLLKPKLLPEEAFRSIVFNLIFSGTNNYYEDDEYHPVFITDDNDPWALDPNDQQVRTNQPNGSNDINIEGRVWFKNRQEQLKSQLGNDRLTPRFE
uniref:EF-hand domain-containing protein n=1 Tax=Theileria annulata TaxID=5874 RepID=A0A3B0MZ44_THEAN